MIRRTLSRLRAPHGLERIARSLLRPFRLGPLQRRLFLIAFVAMLPLALFLSGALLYNARNQKEQLLIAVEDTMRAVITAVDAETNESLAALDALATSASLAAGDLAAFRADALALLERRLEWGNVILLDPSGEQLMNAVNPSSSLPASSLEPETLATAAQGARVVGNMLISPVLDTYGFGVRVPVYTGGEVRYVLTAENSPASVQRLLTSQSIPAGGVVAVFDRNYRIVARSRDIETWLGQPASPGMLRLLESGVMSGWSVTRTLENIAVYSVFYRSSTTGWSAAVGIPIAAVDAPLRRTYVLAFVSVLLSALLGLLASFPVSRTITAPMKQLETAATRVKTGDFPAVPQTWLPEVQKAFAALAEAQRERERMLQSERQARLLEQEVSRLAETTSREKDELLAMLAHEFRNPLSAIASSVELLAQGSRLPEGSVSQTIGIMRRQVKKLAGMTERIIESSRAMSGRIRVERSPIDLEAVVERAVVALREAHETSRHDLVVHTEPVWVEGDPTRLEQVVENVLHNALKHTPAGGRIELTLERAGAEAVLRIRDSGAGIDPDLLPRIFEPFVQGRRTLNQSKDGFGIGLTLVRRVVELHDGSVEALSPGPDRGSEFVIRLPAIGIGIGHAVLAAAGRRASVSGAALRIVVVEDNDDVRTSLRQLLELGGHRVREARDGEAGIEVISEERPDMAIVDIGLPKRNGYGVARAARDLLGTSLRLVALTAYGSDEDVRRGAEAGFDDYLVKPVDPAVVSRIIETVAAEIVVEE